MSENARFYYESALAEKLALSREDIRYIRTEALKKEEGDWEQPGRDVLLSEQGLKKVLGFVYGKDYQRELADFDVCLSDEKKELVELTVVRLFPNRQMLLASLPKEEGRPTATVTVRVPDNTNFRPKMTLKARPPQPDAKAGAKFYQLEGRCPRYPGKY